MNDLISDVPIAHRGHSHISWLADLLPFSHSPSILTDGSRHLFGQQNWAGSQIIALLLVILPLSFRQILPSGLTANLYRMQCVNLIHWWHNSRLISCAIYNNPRVNGGCRGKFDGSFVPLLWQGCWCCRGNAPRRHILAVSALLTDLALIMRFCSGLGRGANACQAHLPGGR